MRHVEHHLDGDLDAPGHSRRLVKGWASEHPRQHEIVLALSELVANAVIHGAAETEHHGVSLRFDDGDGCIRVAVRHPGRVFEPTVRDGHGGLTLVANSVDRWGIEQHGQSVEVWFEIDDPAQSATPASTSPTRPQVS